MGPWIFNFTVFSKKTNLRKDRWGGSLKNRSRLLNEIISSIKNNVPESFIVGIRISPEIEYGNRIK